MMKKQTFPKTLNELEVQLIDMHIAVKHLETALIKVHNEHQMPMNPEISQKISRLETMLIEHYKTLFI